MISFSKTVLQIQALYPGFDISLRYIAIKHTSILNLCSGYDFLHPFGGLTKTAAAGCCEENNSLACEIIALKERIYDTWFTIPPYRELKWSQSPSCVDFTGFNGIQNCVLCYILSISLGIHFGVFLCSTHILRISSFGTS